MLSIEQIEQRIKKVVNKEKLNDEQIKLFFSLLKNVCEDILNPVEEPKTGTPPTVDIDELLKKRMKEDGKLTEDKETGVITSIEKQLSISWLLKQGFAEVLDSGGDYYVTRQELLSHSKILKEHPKSLDFLLVEI